jgi:hypothetical protein
MIKLIDLLENLLENKILVPRRTPEERQKNYLIATQKRIEQYIKNGGQGDLDFNKSPIKSLPDNLKVGGDLILSECINLQSLPNGLEVGKSLILSGTPIKSLPNDLKVNNFLNLRDTPLSQKYTEGEIQSMIPNFKGKLLI